MTCKKKSQTNPSVLFAIITLIVVLYLILIPPDYRAKLLNDNNDTDDSDVSDYDVTYLSKEPGLWSYNSLKSIDHDLNSFNLVSRTQANNIIGAKSLKSKSTAFSKEISSFKFNLNNIYNMQNFYINFKIISQIGDAYLVINGVTVKKIDEGLPEYAINLDKNYFNNGENVVEFISERVGFAFWKYNEIEISSAEIFADILDDSGLYNSQKAWIGKDEYLNMEDSLFRYYAGCDLISSKKLDILLNKEIIFSGIPDCNMLNTINHVDKSILKEGDNLFEFRTDGGSYLFDNVVFKTTLKESEFPTYYFSITDEDYDYLQTELIEVNLTMTFVDELEYKEMDVLLNGHSIGISTYDRVYTSEVYYGYFEKGNNVLQIRPKNTINIVDLKLRGLFD